VFDTLPLLLFALILLIAVIGWGVARPPAVFVVRVRGGIATAVSGKVTAAFLGAVGEIFQELNLSQGEIRGLARGRQIRLWFSPGIPQVARQRLRNWWAMSGWSAGPKR
jgi:hypothetical protein